jgi:hypothetical protein
VNNTSLPVLFHVFFFAGYLKMQGCLLGLEFSGVDSSGQRIMGLLSAKGTIRYFY